MLCYVTRLRPCLQETEELPKDFTRLFSDGLFRLEPSLIPEAVALFSTLHVKHEVLNKQRQQREIGVNGGGRYKWLGSAIGLWPKALPSYN